MAGAASFYDAIEGDGVFLLGGVTVRGHDMIDGDSFAVLKDGAIRMFGRFSNPLAVDGLWCQPGDTMVVSRRYYERVLDGRVSAKLQAFSQGVVFTDEVDRWRDTI